MNKILPILALLLLTCSEDPISPYDACGVLNGDNSSCTDCAGAVNGNSLVDECGVCDNDSTNDNITCTDNCGEINGDNSSCADECYIFGGSDFNGDSRCQIDLDILEGFKECSTLYDENTSVYDVGIQSWSGYRLHTLDVSNINITCIPENIGDLSHLEYLYAANNNITSIPESICDLETVNRIDLSNNLIISLPSCLWKLTDTINTGNSYLNLSNNQIISIPSYFCDFRYEHPSIEGTWFSIVDVCNNNICSEFWHECAPAPSVANMACLNPNTNPYDSGQNISNCCEGVNNEGETVPHWTTCP